MNKTYRLVWSLASHTWRVAPESASRRVTGGGARSILGSLLLVVVPVQAAELPSGGEVVDGEASLERQGDNLTIQQNSQRAAIEWDEYSIGEGNTVRYDQPGSEAAALNRVTGDRVSEIRGALEANGRVFLVNPNGVHFSPSARVDVGSLVASTLDISTEDFMNGDYRFEGGSANAVINQGNITTAEGGTVAMIAAEIVNTGTIETPRGNTLMGAGSTVTLDLGGPVQIEVEEANLDTMIEQGGAIRADGGRVLLTAKAANDLTASVINHSGITEAKTLASGENGEIKLMGDMESGRVEVAGRLDASAPEGGDGGFVETSAAEVSIANEVQVTTRAADGPETSGETGEWLIDPTDFNIRDGDDTQSDSGIGAETLSSNLANNDMTLQTVDSGSENGDINVNAAVDWDADTTLTLDAHGDINLNAALTATGDSAGLALDYDGSDYYVNAPVTLSGDNASLSVNGTSYTLIQNVDDLQAMSDDLGGRYALGQDIDASSIDNFQPVGNDDDRFTGSLHGLGHAITDLTFDGGYTAEYNGLFGYAGASTTLRDLGLLRVDIMGDERSGALVGANRGRIHNVHATGRVEGSLMAGGLVGYNYGTISNVYADVATSRLSYAGGLVGINDGTINNAYATGPVSGEIGIGGLVGNNYGAINNAYATGSVNGGSNTGGLVGWNEGAIDNVYVTGRVSSENTFSIGGLVGDISSSGTVSNAYWDSYTTGQPGASGDSFVRSAVEVSSDPNDTGTPSAFDQSSYDGFDFTTTPGGDGWYMIDGETRPFGAWEHATRIDNAHQLQLIAMAPDGVYTLGRGLDMSDALSAVEGRYPGMWSEHGFVPLGDGDAGFSGSFDGAGKTIGDLTIGRSSQDYVGLFGYTEGATLSQIGLENADVTGGEHVGGLVGYNDGGSTISRSYTTGNVSGTDNVGGLVGHNRNDNTVSQSYATGKVTGNTSVGGLVGDNSGIIEKTYATGSVSGTSGVGGLVGGNDGTVTGSYYATTDADGNAIDGNHTNNIGTPKTSLELMNPATFTNVGWDLSARGGEDTSWRIYDGYTTPLLSDFLASVTVTADSREVIDKTYDGQVASGDDLGYSTNANSPGLSGTLAYRSASADASHYRTSDGSFVLSGLYSGQQGYDISYDETSLVINKADAAVTANSATTAYDGTEHSVSGFSVSGLVNGEGEAVLDNITTSGGRGTDAGTYVHTVSGTDDNYDLTFTDGALTIDKADATVTVNSDTVTYDGTDQSVTGFSASGLVNGEDEAVLSDVTTSGGRGTDAGIYAHTASGMDENYKLTFTDGALTIDKADATVTANSATTTYDGTDQSVTGFSASGLVNGEDEAVLSDVTTSGGRGTDAGTYGHTAGGMDENYSLTFTDGALEIDKADATVTANSATTTYDGTEQSVSGFTASGLVSGEDEAVLGDVTTSGGSGTDAGSYAHAVSGTDENYNLTFDDGALTIDKADVTVTANSATTTYDGTEQAATGFTASGLVNGEDEAVLTDVTISGGRGTDAGTYGHTASGTDENYTLTFDDGALTIDKAPLTVTANDATRTYDGQAYSGGNGVTYQGFVNNEDVSVLTGSPDYGGSSQGATNAGNYAITPGGLSADNYDLNVVDGQLAIDPRALTISGTTAADKTYDGETDATISVGRLSNLVDNETLNVSASGSFDSANAGSRTATARYTLSDGSNGGLAGNYRLADTSGLSANIDPAPLTVTANSDSLTYDGTEQSVSGFTAEGLVDGEDETVLGDVTTSGGSGTDAGTYAHTASGMDENYNLTFADGALTIERRPVVVTADDQRKTEGSADPVFTWQTGCGALPSDCGLVAGERLEGSLTRDSGDAPGNYAIRQGSVNDATNPNYAIDFVSGRLDIAEANAGPQPGDILFPFPARSTITAVQQPGSDDETDHVDADEDLMLQAVDNEISRTANAVGVDLPRIRVEDGGIALPPVQETPTSDD